MDIILVSIIGLFLITFTFTVMENLRRSVADRSAEDKFEDVANYIASSVTKTYMTGINTIPVNPTGIIKADISVDIPSSISGYTYYVVITNTDVVIEIVDISNSPENLKLDVSASIVGIDPSIITPTRIYSTQGHLQITYTRVGNNTATLVITG
jgi:hypothetical protein